MLLLHPVVYKLRLVCPFKGVLVHLWRSTHPQVFSIPGFLVCYVSGHSGPACFYEFSVDITKSFCFHSKGEFLHLVWFVQSLIQGIGQGCSSFVCNSHPLNSMDLKESSY
jgi:hypothetical protein